MNPISVTTTDALQRTDVRLRLTEMVGEISRRFIDVPFDDIRTSIDEALRRIAELCEFKRAVLYELSDDRKRFSITHRYLAPGIEPTEPVGVEQPIERFGYVAARLTLKQPIVIASDSSPEDATAERSDLSVGGMTHAAVFPLVVGDDPLGAVTFAGLASPDSTVVEMLGIVGELFTSALHRERVERGFRYSEQRFARVVASALDGFAMIGESGVVLDWTVQAERILGFSRSEMLGGLLQSVLVERDRTSFGSMANLYAGAMKTPERRLELAGRHRDGHEVPIELSISLLEGEQSTAYGVFIRDITERKRAEVVRQQAFDEITRLKRQIEGERDYLREEIREGRQVGDLVGESPALERVIALIESVASTSATVLIRGESGVGKELIARAIHSRSRRSEEPLVKVNCASVPKELFESEFFGHVRGAFTGALKDRAGRFELADRGTLFLDEVGEIPLDLQAKLLRVLQEKEFERVGAEQTRKVDVRILAATNRDLAAEAAAGRFRKDLYYRLSVFPIEIPPLRERREDILPLAEHFLKLQRRNLGRPHLALDDLQRRQLLAYDWPGNVRELQHVIERAVILAREGPLKLGLALPPADAIEPAVSRKEKVLTDDALRAIERENLTTALDRCDWRISGTGGAAELLGLSPSTLRDRMRVFDIQRPKRA